ncbi:MAG: transcription elongation factor GreA [Pseudomonadota bacterium]|jgi:transcription elongation factor GreA|nr:transcription elongation factor GreA [Pseudomonadota bacterium]MEC7999648.1 transcription elongation factor GreA [Pseudomonadota bacterium]|tara:strand:+ start:333 stop:809 length:477 start_codon:yes stop_codon:yes gene_type:complete
MITNPLTVQGEKVLRERLTDLKFVQRPQISEAIAEARAHGDLKENAEYHAAREQQGLIEAKIKEIESTLSNATIIDVKELPQTGRVVFGSTVKLFNLETENPISYKIVGSLESDPAQGSISFDTPIGKGLIGKSIGDEVTIETPAGSETFEIEDVLHI